MQQIINQNFYIIITNQNFHATIINQNFYATIINQDMQQLFFFKLIKTFMHHSLHSTITE